MWAFLKRKISNREFHILYRPNMEIIVNADDFGKSHEVNLGIVEAFKRDIIQRTTLMVNMPYVDEAVELAIKNGFFEKVGLHLNLTEGVPLTEGVKEFGWICSGHTFNDRIRQYCRRHLHLSSTAKEAIKCEIEAQIQKYIAYGFPLMHFDSHQHVHNEFFIYSIIEKISKQYGFVSTRIPRNLMDGHGFKNRIKLVYKYWIQSLINKSFTGTKYFGSYPDFCDYGGTVKGSVEIMVHPILKGKMLYDIIEGIEVPMISKL